jgi:hypothetical protein
MLRGSCHRDVSCLGVADGGDGLQIRRAAVNILNKQSRTGDKFSPPDWVMGEGLTTFPTLKYQLVTKCYTGPGNWLRIGTSGRLL